MGQTFHGQPDSEDRQKIFEMIKDINIAMMVTRGVDGRLYARPMGTQQPDDEGNLWFFTTGNSPKVLEIGDNPTVLLSYADKDKNNYISISGMASIVRDQYKNKALWSEALKTWFPDGPDDPNLCLIKVEPDSAEYWDSPSNAFVVGFGYIKAKLTGEPEKFGENRTVAL